MYKLQLNGFWYQTYEKIYFQKISEKNFFQRFLDFRIVTKG